MASEHVHTWVYVADESAPVQPGKYIALNMKLHRFCTECDVRQELLSQTVLDEQQHKIEQLEQQLAQARQDAGLWQQRATALEEQATFIDMDIKAQNAKLREELAQARNLVGRLYAAFSLDTWSEGQEQACKEAEAFLGKEA